AALAFCCRCGEKMREAHLFTTPTTLFVRRSRKNPQREKAKMLRIRHTLRNGGIFMRTWSEDHPKARLLERKQEAIKEAARMLFLQHGYANTTMEMVAEHAGVSIMTLYRH